MISPFRLLQPLLLTPLLGLRRPTNQFEHDVRRRHGRDFGVVVRWRHLHRAKGPAAERLYHFIFEDIAYLCRSPYDLSGVHVTEIMQDHEFSFWHERLERLHGAIRDMVQQGVERGEFVDVDPTFAQEMITAMNIVNIKRYSGRTPESVDAVARMSADFALRALLRDGAALDEIAST
jgi:Tetracyclin repressor-like, C-terminal domain